MAYEQFDHNTRTTDVAEVDPQHPVFSEDTEQYRKAFWEENPDPFQKGLVAGRTDSVL
jgi:hypothetical protein